MEVFLALTFHQFVFPLGLFQAFRIVSVLTLASYVTLPISISPFHRVTPASLSIIFLEGLLVCIKPNYISITPVPAQ